MSDFDNTEAIKPNKKFKDTIFRYIFSNPDKFSELYEAISGKHFSNEEIEEANLDSLVISDWRNDVSFITKNRHIIILLEQQSSLCVNMSVRCLVYYSNLLRKLYEEDYNGLKTRLYSGSEVKIPKPEFYVLYIGSRPLPNEIELLSTHFVDKDNSNIELRVRNIDIHYDKLSEKNLDTSETLVGYSYLVQQYIYYKENLVIENNQEKEKQALKMAINDCKKRGYLLEFVDRKEFIVMAYEEFTLNDFIALKEREATAEGIEKGKRESILNMYNSGLSITQIANIMKMEKNDIKNIVSK